MSKKDLGIARNGFVPSKIPGIGESGRGFVPTGIPSTPNPGSGYVPPGIPTGPQTPPSTDKDSGGSGQGSSSNKGD